MRGKVSKNCGPVARVLLGINGSRKLVLSGIGENCATAKRAQVPGRRSARGDKDADSDGHTARHMGHNVQFRGLWHGAVARNLLLSGAPQATNAHRCHETDSSQWGARTLFGHSLILSSGEGGWGGRWACILFL